MYTHMPNWLYWSSYRTFQLRAFQLKKTLKENPAISKLQSLDGGSIFYDLGDAWEMLGEFTVILAVKAF